MQVDQAPTHQDDRCWLKWPVADTRPKVRQSGSSRKPKGESSVNISGLTVSEFDAIESFLKGGSYLRVIDGRLHAYDVYEPLPDPETDPIIAPHFDARISYEALGKVPSGEGWHSPGIVLSHLVGNAAKDARKLKSWGFSCMRSPRGRCGGYWEQYVLHGMWQAKGDLKKHMDGLGKLSWSQEAESACKFVVDQRIRFGTLDITIQRWALACPD